MKRTCKKCKIEKRYDKFTKSKVCRDGISHECKECNNARRRKSGYSRGKREADKERAKLIVAGYRKLKQSMGCDKCGEDTPECLEFHHVNQNKDKNINPRMVLESQLEELLKCAVVCANCHRKIHAKILSEPAPMTEEEIRNCGADWNPANNGCSSRWHFKNS